MSLEERSGNRDLLYSRWHRPSSIGRFLDNRSAATLKVVDIDWCESCHFCSAPLALIETQRSAAAPKSAAITLQLAQQARIAAYSVSYQPTADGTDIEQFRWKRLWPPPFEAGTYTPAEYAQFLVSLRTAHATSCERRAA